MGNATEQTVYKYGYDYTSEEKRDRLIEAEKSGEWSSDFDSLNNLAPCPRCKNLRSRIRTTRQAECGFRVRYHVCPVCTLRFKSIEILQT